MGGGEVTAPAGQGVLPRPEIDTFLLRCFRDFASADALYKKGE